MASTVFATLGGLTFLSLVACADQPTAVNAGTQPPVVSRVMVPPPLCTTYCSAEDLGALRGHANSWAMDINDAGVIVGTSSSILAPGKGHAVEWNDGVIRDLGVYPGDTYSTARAINDAGTIVGWSEGANGPRAVIWNPGASPVLLDRSNRTSGAHDINASGVVVGEIETAFGDFHAFRWTAKDGIDDLSATLPRGASSAAYGINDVGLVVGAVTRNGITHAYVWNSAGVGTDLGTLASSHERSEARALNSAGEVVGGSQTAGQSNTFAFRWTPSTGMVPLAGVSDDVAWYSNASAVSDAQRYVGQVLSDSGSKGKAFTKRGSGGVRLLPTLASGASTRASSVNRCGTIVGGADIITFHAPISHRAVVWRRLVCDS
jgi:probable HAF family extracellular repeat protein